MLIAVFDESGTHSGSPAITVAGWVSTTDLWGLFRTRWTETLAANGLVAFHMSEFTAHEGPFRDEHYWTEERRFALIDRLTAIILNTTLFGVSHSFAGPDDYRRVMGHTLAPEVAVAPYHHPYIWCLHHCLYGIVHTKADLARYPGLEQFNFGTEKILCVLDRGAKMGRYILPAFQSWTRDWGSDLLGPLFESVSNPEFCGLQAADILAFETFRYVKGQSVDSAAPQRKLLTRLVNDGARVIGHMHDQATLLELLRKIPTQH